MSFSKIKAHLNLYAVIQNFEDLIELDPKMNELTADWDVSIQFTVSKGPKAWVKIKRGQCTVGRGSLRRPKIRLHFFSNEHLNNMFSQGATPFLLKGITRIGFLTKEFPKLTKRLEYYLKHDEQKLKDPKYMEINTRLTMNTAAFSIREIGLLDPVVKNVASHIRDGVVAMKVLDNGPAVSVCFAKGDIIPSKGEVEEPLAKIDFKNMQVANDFLNGKSDAFSDIASGNVIIKGQTPMIDNMNLILDRIPVYL